MVSIYLTKAIINAPVVIKIEPIKIGAVIFSFKINPAKIIVKTKLSLSIGTTFEASPTFKA